jgi:HEAT repeat protein
MNPVLIELSLAFGLLNMIIALLVIGNRFIVRLRDRRHAAAIESLRFGLLEWISGEAPSVAPPRNSVEGKALVDLLSKYGRSLTGDGRRRVVELADQLHLTTSLLIQTRSALSWRRAAAAFRLGDLGDRQSWRLVALLDDRNRQVRNAAARSLGKQRAVEGVAPIVLALSEGRVARAVGGQALIDIGPDAVESMAGLMHSQSPDVRAVAAELLGRLGTVSQAGVLTRHLHDNSANVRVAVVRALGRLGGRAAAESIRHVLDDQTAYVRAAAATSVAALGDLDSVPRLLEMVDDTEYLPARAAAIAITELSPETARSEAAAAGNEHLQEAVDLLELHR